jgi:glycosyltransferase involved in cell wall biosynthesis
VKITVITPNYNYAKYIGKAIESVVNQDYENIEHIIVDDGSTDNSVEIIKRYQQQYPGKIKLIQQENKGQTPALNVALSHITGDIICWLNSDDYFFSKDVFSNLIKEFVNNRKVDVVFGNIAIIDKEDKINRYKKYFDFSYTAGVFIGFGRIMSSNAVFWRKEIMLGITFNEEFTYSMDADFFSRLLFRRKTKHIDKIIYR